MAKQNKFTKSVMERLAEADKAGEGSSPPKTIPTTPTIITKTVDAKKPIKKAAPSSVGFPAPSLPDISQFITKKDARSAKNKTFYLDTDVIDTIKSVSKEQKLTDSRLVNDILRKVLGLGDE